MDSENKRERAFEKPERPENASGLNDPKIPTGLNLGKPGRGIMIRFPREGGKKHYEVCETLVVDGRPETMEVLRGVEGGSGDKVLLCESVCERRRLEKYLVLLEKPQGERKCGAREAALLFCSDSADDAIDKFCEELAHSLKRWRVPVHDDWP